MRRYVSAASLAAASVAIWLTVFFGGAYALVRLLERLEGADSECGRAECGRLGEFLDEHDLLAVILLAFIAAVPAVLLLWKARSRLETTRPARGARGPAP